jgi:hypothetical protein
VDRGGRLKRGPIAVTAVCAIAGALAATTLGRDAPADRVSGIE